MGAGDQGRGADGVPGGGEVVQPDDGPAHAGQSPGDQQGEQQRGQDDRPRRDVDLRALGEQPQPAGQRRRPADGQAAGGIQGRDDDDGQAQTHQPDDGDRHRGGDAEPDERQRAPVAVGTPAAGQTCQQGDHVTTVANARRIVAARAGADGTGAARTQRRREPSAPGVAGPSRRTAGSHRSDGAVGPGAVARSGRAARLPVRARRRGRRRVVLLLPRLLGRRHRLARTAERAVPGCGAGADPAAPAAGRRWARAGSPTGRRWPTHRTGPAGCAARAAARARRTP